jgi:hypothetical protein
MPTLNKRLYFHYEELEECHAGMWRITRGETRKECIARAAALMKDAPRFKAAMVEAIAAWPKSCAAAFTADAVNQIAWLGHAGCCIAAQSPEEATRAAWHTLTRPEQDEANKVAAEALLTWSRPAHLFEQLELFGEDRLGA